MENRRSMIELKKIVKRFYEGKPNELEILHGIDLTVKEGEFVSIVGESGSGKSTLMNIIGALDRPTMGDYILTGIDVAKAKDKELSEIRNQQIGFVFQTYNLIAGPRHWPMWNYLCCMGRYLKGSGPDGPKSFLRW